MKRSKSCAMLFPLLLLLLLMNSCDTSLNIKSPVKNYFIKYFGNEGSQTGVDFIVNPDGTFVLFGTTQVQGKNSQFYLVKVDQLGDTLWTRKYGSQCQARDIELAKDGRIVVLGNMVHPSRTDYDITLMIWNQDGTKSDSLPLINYTDRITSLDADEDASTVTETFNGFIIAGSSGNIDVTTAPDPLVLRDALFIKVLSNPLAIAPAPWPTIPTAGQATENISTRIIQRPDSSFYVFGYAKYSNSSGTKTNDFNAWYFNLGKSGGVPAGGVPTFGFPNTDEKIGSVAVYPGGYFLGGVSSNNGTNEVYILQLRDPLAFDDTDAQNQTPGTLKFSLGKSNDHTSVFASSNGFFLLTNELSTTNSNMLLTKFTLNASTAWSTPIILGGAGDDFAGSVKELPDGKIVIVGTMTIGQASVNNGETKMVLIKVNQDGQFTD